MKNLKKQLKQHLRQDKLMDFEQEVVFYFHPFNSFIIHTIP